MYKEYRKSQKATGQQQVSVTKWMVYRHVQNCKIKISSDNPFTVRMATCRRTKSNWMLRGRGIREEDLRPSVLYITHRSPNSHHQGLLAKENILQKERTSFCRPHSWRGGCVIAELWLIQRSDWVSSEFRLEGEFTAAQGRYLSYNWDGMDKYISRLSHPRRKGTFFLFRITCLRGA